MEHRVEYMDLDTVTPAIRNPKHHDTEGIARSISHHGVAELPLLDERTDRLIAGHGRLTDLRTRRDNGGTPPAGVHVDTDGRWLVPVVRGWASRSDEDAEAYLVASNHLTTKGGWDDQALVQMLADLNDADPALLELTGFTDDDLAELLAAGEDEPGGGGDGPGSGDPDAVPDVAAVVVTKPGDLWLLGPHKILCGDSTSLADVRRVTGGETVTLIHADPPYGMGKEADGVANDNLYGPKLDAFQMRWWAAWLAVLAENGSAYIWGNAPDLWRLWWLGGLSNDPDLMVRNELVWDKETIAGMASPELHSYPTATERCLLIMRGEQFLGNQNKDAYWEGYEPLRLWLSGERDRAGLTNRDVNALTGSQMAGHWFTQSQFMPISRKHYEVLRDATGGRAFARDYDELFDSMFPGSREGGNAHRRSLAEQLREGRSYFDNAHDIMADVWRFPRVLGEERFGHATPKPVAMVERALKSSSREGDLVAAPFGGTGPEFIAAHRLGRRCVGIELEPNYVDVICRRYQQVTGTKPVLESTGETHDFSADDPGEE